MRKLLTTIIPFLTALLLFNACSHKYYTNSNFDNLTVTHKNIAIVPVEIKLLGNKPKKMTEQDIIKQEEAESKVFQQSLFNNVLAYSNDKNYYTDINILSLEKTNTLLNSSNINYTNIATKDDETLCKLLQVDAVVRLRISKTRYMSDLAGLGADVLNDVLFNTVGVFIPGTTTSTPRAPEKTNDVKTICTVQANGNVLWNNNYDVAANWQRPANELIENITKRYAKTFPYRKKKK